MLFWTNQKVEDVYFTPKGHLIGKMGTVRWCHKKRKCIRTERSGIDSKHSSTWRKLEPCAELLRKGGLGQGGGARGQCQER